MNEKELIGRLEKIREKADNIDPYYGSPSSVDIVDDLDCLIKDLGCE